MAQVHIVIVEDDLAYVRAVQQRLETSGQYTVDAVAHNAAEANRVPVKPGSIWLIDLGLPDGSGIQLIEPLVEAGAQVLVTTVFEDEQRVVAAIRAGAAGYHLKSEADILKAVDDVVQGFAPLSPRIATHVLSMLRPQRANTSDELIELSPRELQTLQALAHGYSYREVAENHRVSHHTVGDHVKSIYRKLRVHSKTEAINVALKQGILSINEV